MGKTSSSANDKCKEPSQVITFGTDAQQKISPSESCASVSSHEMVWKVPDGIKKPSVVFSHTTGEENTAETSESMEGTNSSTSENLDEAPVALSDPMETEKLMNTDQPLERTNVSDPEVSRDNSHITDETFLKPASEMKTKTMIAPLEGSCSSAAFAPLTTESQPIVYSREHLENAIITALKMLNKALRSFGEVPAIHYKMHKESKEKLLVILNSIGILTQDSKSEDPPLPDNVPQDATIAKLDGSPGNSHESEHNMPTAIEEVSTETSFVVSSEREIQGTENELIVATGLNAVEHLPESNEIMSVIMRPDPLEEDAKDCTTSCESLECVEVVPHEMIEAPPELISGASQRPPHAMDLEEEIAPEEFLGRSGCQSPDVSSDESNNVRERSPSREDLQNMIIRESLPVTGFSGNNTPRTPPEMPTTATYTSSPATEVQDQLEAVESSDGPGTSPYECLRSIDESSNINLPPSLVEVESTETQDESRLSPREGLDAILAVESCDSLQYSSISSAETIHVADDIREHSSMSSPSSEESLHAVDDISEYSNVSSPSSGETRLVADDISECSSICSPPSEETLHVVDDISEYSNVSSPSSGETRHVADDISEYSSISSPSSEEINHDVDDISEYSNVSSPSSADDDVREYSDISSSSSEEILPIADDISEYSNISSSSSDVQTEDSSESLESSGFSSRETLITTSDVTTNQPYIDSAISVQGSHEAKYGSLKPCTGSLAIATDDTKEAVNILGAAEKQPTLFEAQEQADFSAYDACQIAEAEEVMEADESLECTNAVYQELPIDVPNDIHTCPSTLLPEVGEQTSELEGTPKSRSRSANEITFPTQECTASFDCPSSLTMDVEDQQLEHYCIHPPAVEVQGSFDTGDSGECRSSPSNKSVEVVSDAVTETVNMPSSSVKVEPVTHLSGQPCGFEIAPPEWSSVTTHELLDIGAEVTIEDDTSSPAMDIKPCVPQEGSVMPADDIVATVSQVVSEGHSALSDTHDAVEAREPRECFNVSLSNQVYAAAGEIIGIPDSVFEEQDERESKEQQGNSNVTSAAASASYIIPSLEELQNAPLPDEPFDCANIPIYDTLHTSPKVTCDAGCTFPPAMKINSKETTEPLVSSDKIVHSHEAPFSQLSEMEVELTETKVDGETVQPVQQTISAGFQPMAPSSSNGCTNLSQLNHNALGSVRKHGKAAYGISFEEDEEQPLAKASYITLHNG